MGKVSALKAVCGWADAGRVGVGTSWSFWSMGNAASASFSDTRYDVVGREPCDWSKSSTVLLDDEGGSGLLAAMSVVLASLSSIVSSLFLFVFLFFIYLDIWAGPKQPLPCRTN